MNASDRSRPLQVGDPVPEFSGHTAAGRTFARADLLGHRTVLFFYPKASSAGCTLEAREFARLQGEFQAVGATIVGVSVDPIEAEQRFRDHCELPFDLVADDDRSISRRFGVLGALRVARRTTFVVGPDGTVAAVVRTWRPNAHPASALASLRALPSAPASPPSRETSP